MAVFPAVGSQAPEQVREFIAEHILVDDYTDPKFYVTRATVEEGGIRFVYSFQRERFVKGALTTEEVAASGFLAVNPERIAQVVTWEEDEFRALEAQELKDKGALRDIHIHGDVVSDTENAIVEDILFLENAPTQKDANRYFTYGFVD